MAQPWDPSMGGAPPGYHDNDPRVGGGMGGAPPMSPYSGAGGAPEALEPGGDVAPMPRPTYEPPPAEPVAPEEPSLPAYLTREAQEMLLADQRPAPARRPAPAGGAGWAPRLEGVQLYDDQLAQMDADFAARRHRILEDPTMDQRAKAQLLAQVQAEHTSGRADVSAKRAAFLQTSSGMGERMAQLAMQGQHSQMQHQADAAGLARDAAEQQNVALGHQQDRRQMQLRAEQQERAEIQKRVTQAENGYRAAIDEYNAARKDDSGGKFGVGQSVLGGLGLVLSAIATGITGKDYAGKTVAILEKAVDRAMREHQQKLANKRADVGFKRDLIGMVRSQYQDAEQGWAAARLALKEQAINEVQQLRNTAAGKRAGAQLDATVEQLDIATEQDRIALRKSAVDRYNLERQAAAQAAAAQAAARQRAARVQAYGQELTDKDEARLIPGAGLLLRGGDVKEAREQYAQITNQKQLFARAGGILEKAKSGQVLSPTDKEKLNMLRMQIAAPTMAELFGAGNEEQLAQAAATAGVPVMDWTDRQWKNMEQVIGQGRALSDAKHQNWVDRNVDRGATLSYTDPETGRTVWHFRRGEQAGGGAEIKPGVAR